jgi:transcriptional repressor NrdR
VKCPYCKKEQDRVVDSRSARDGFAIRRRRECLACSRRFTTYEEPPLRVLKKSGERVPFDREKILSGLRKACQKRPVNVETLDQVAEDIEAEIRRQCDRQVPTAFIGELVMKHLAKLDQVAYVRFASVYREFKDVREFVDEVKPMLRS